MHIIFRIIFTVFHYKGTKWQKKLCNLILLPWIIAMAGCVVVVVCWAEIVDETLLDK